LDDVSNARAIGTSIGQPFMLGLYERSLLARGREQAKEEADLTIDTAVSAEKLSFGAAFLPNGCVRRAR
jgi:hypothetical protein